MMKVSVVIPTFNSSRTIDATLTSVFLQTFAPYEVIVLDDGSTDATLAVLRTYSERVKVIHQQNKGVAVARNFLAGQAEGDLIAFLDHDDIWHPSYLEVQAKAFNECPNIVASFAGHVNFVGYGQYQWHELQLGALSRAHILNPFEFFNAYDADPGRYGSASFLCVPKAVLKSIGNAPFLETASGADDNYLCRLLPLLGPVAYVDDPLVAYRITKDAQSDDQLKAFRLGVDVLIALESRYQHMAGPRLRRAFFRALASRRRQYAKRLLRAGKHADARRELRHSVTNSLDPRSISKSLALFLSTYLPAALQPKWPSIHREYDRD